VLDHHSESLHLHVDLIDPVGSVCSACEAVHNGPVHSLGWVRVEDLPLSGKRVFLYIPKRKIRCPNDGNIRVEEHDILHGRFTRRFANQTWRLTSITTTKRPGGFSTLMPKWSIEPIAAY